MPTTASKIKNVYQQYLLHKFAKEKNTSPSILFPLKEDGQGGFMFSDLDYSSPIKSNWPAGEHLIRLLSFIGQAGEELIQDAQKQEIVKGLLSHWLSRDYICPNWWHNDIGVPLRLGQIAILCDEFLPNEIKPLLFSRIKRGTYLSLPNLKAGFGSTPESERTPFAWTGANFLWGMTCSFGYGILTKDQDILDTVCKEIEYQFLYPGEEGVKPDHSFYQHGTRWYSGGYGRSFLSCVTPMICGFLSAEMPFSEKALEVFLGQFLDGTRYFTHHGYYDYHAVGRELSRKNALWVGEIKTAVEILCTLPHLPRLDEMRAFREELNGKIPEDTTRFYPFVSHLTHRHGDLYFGITGINQGEMGAEHCNGEGVLCYHMTYGTRTAYMGTGKEYFNLDPLFDYAHVPGTTTFDETDEELYKRDLRWTNQVCQDRCLVAETDAEGGILTQTVRHDGISYISTFIVENGILVALGTAMENTTGKPLHTTIDQCFSENVEIVSHTLAHAGCFSYHILQGEGSFTYQKRQGNCCRNNLECPSSPVEGEVFLAEIQNVKDQYAYAITPRNSANSAEILANLPTFQAVRMPSGKIYLACYTRKTFTYNGKTVMGNPLECYIF